MQRLLIGYFIGVAIGLPFAPLTSLDLVGGTNGHSRPFDFRHAPLPR
jgi:hypothetical protein